VWVVSGDYKLEDDHFCAPFESVPCHSFITEATFALPIYKWQPQQVVMNEINSWHAKNKELGITSLLTGYALGKMQRILKNIHLDGDHIYAHGAVYIINEKLREAGYDLPPLTLVSNEVDKKSYAGALVLAPPLSNSTPWTKRFSAFSLGYCSGWMAVRGAKNRRALDQGFILSDHADWPDLHTAIKNTGAEKIYVTHGFTNAFARWLNETGIQAAEVHTMYGDEEGEEDPEGLKNDNPEVLQP
jgi:putative mRNA 3-end processing factor